MLVHVIITYVSSPFIYLSIHPSIHPSIQPIIDQFDHSRNSAYAPNILHWLGTGVLKECYTSHTIRSPDVLAATLLAFLISEYCAMKQKRKQPQWTSPSLRKPRNENNWCKNYNKWISRQHIGVQNMQLYNAPIKLLKVKTMLLTRNKQKCIVLCTKWHKIYCRIFIYVMYIKILPGSCEQTVFKNEFRYVQRSYDLKPCIHIPW